MCLHMCAKGISKFAGNHFTCGVSKSVVSDLRHLLTPLISLFTVEKPRRKEKNKGGDCC